MKGMELANEELKIHEKAILRLSEVINVNERNIIQIAKQLEANPELVLSTPTDLPFDIEYRAALTTEDFRSNRMDVTHSLHISDLVTSEFKKLTESSLTLQNHRLPLLSNFLLAVRTKCLALQHQREEQGGQLLPTVQGVHCPNFLEGVKYWDNWDAIFLSLGTPPPHSPASRLKCTCTTTAPR